MDKWRYYLERDQFIIKINPKSLKFLLQQRLHAQLQKKGMTKLMLLDYVIQYRKGKENKAANALSKCVEEGTMALITSVVPVVSGHYNQLLVRWLVERTTGIAHPGP